MSDALMKKSSLRNYKVISEPGTFVVKSANAIRPEYLYEDGAKSRFIVNLRCATVDGFEECIGIMGNKELVPFDKIKHCFMSGTIWENEIDDLTRLPAKGEDIIATFDYVDDILRCTAITLIPRKELNNFDLDAICKSRQIFKKLMKNE